MQHHDEHPMRFEIVPHRVTVKLFALPEIRRISVREAHQSREEIPARLFGDTGKMAALPLPEGVPSRLFGDTGKMPALPIPEIVRELKPGSLPTPGAKAPVRVDDLVLDTPTQDPSKRGGNDG